ncbi:GNAT family N-acetyltransferase [Bacillus sp. AK031]
MSKYVFEKIPNLLKTEISHLLKESQTAGFRFLERLVNDYREGFNTFNKQGEQMAGVFSEGRLIAIGGLNRDPFSGEGNIGRLRRFYVAKEYRRTGIGRKLVEKILEGAGETFDVIVLNTDTDQADRFYRSLGFLKEVRYPNATHYFIPREGSR